MLTFAAAAALLTITPGLDSMYVLRTVVGSGRATGLVAGAGISLGVLAWGVATAVGLTALLLASPVGYEVVQVIGAGYLFFVGVRMLWRSRRGAARDVDADPADLQMSRWRAFRTGLLTNVLNPKVGVFYVTLLPQFIPRGASVLTTSLLLTTIHVALGLAWFTVIALLVGRIRHLVARAAVRRRIEQVTGVAFLGFGVRVGACPQGHLNPDPGLSRINGCCA